MNSVNLVGRLTRDPEVRYTAGENAMAVAKFAIAVDRPTQGEKKADFPNIVIFGRQAENCEKYLSKGGQVAIHGRIQTGKYEDKDGRMVYTTEVVANSVEFLGSKSDAEKNGPVKGFMQLEEDVPF